MQHGGGALGVRLGQEACKTGVPPHSKAPELSDTASSTAEGGKREGSGRGTGAGSCLLLRPA